ncbi:hypothetical protein N7527_005195 [Penicillium freii]|nr:hypothetical protein N7527_005195 [Penicillium freii]
MVQLSARDVVHNALPQLHVSENHTKSSAWHPIYFVGPLAPWGNFVRDVQNFDASQVWSRVVIDHELVSRDLHREKVWLGDEHGLQGRFQQSVGQIVGAALEAQSINITFGDFKASGVAYDKVPDVALLAKGPTFVLPSSSKRILILSNPCAMAILPYLEYIIGQLLYPIHGHDRLHRSNVAARRGRLAVQIWNRPGPATSEYHHPSRKGYRDGLPLHRAFPGPGG